MRCQKRIDRRIGLFFRLVLLLVACASGVTLSRAESSSLETQMAAVKAERREAIFQVQHIVNQPVTQLKRTPNMVVTMYPAWFHPGSIEPDYDTVDVRTTRHLDYEGYLYVASDLNPNVVFVGRELEFNSMTKFFYSDRSVPKKKLTEAEMEEINRLYRVIGRCNAQLVELQKPRTMFLGLDLTRARDTIAHWSESKTGSSVLSLMMKFKYALVAATGLLLVALVLIRNRRHAT